MWLSMPDLTPNFDLTWGSTVSSSKFQTRRSGTCGKRGITIHSVTHSTIIYFLQGGVLHIVAPRTPTGCYCSEYNACSRGCLFHEARVGPARADRGRCLTAASRYCGHRPDCRLRSVRSSKNGHPAKNGHRVDSLATAALDRHSRDGLGLVGPRVSGLRELRLLWGSHPVVQGTGKRQ